MPNQIIFDEDEALKAKLQHIRLYDLNKATPTGREIPVWFRLPDTEQRTVEYPMITIDFINISFAPERAHAGRVYMNYLPDEREFAFPLDHTFTTEFPIPYNLDYIVTAYSRNPLHDRQIMAELLKPERLPLRFGYLENLPDGTIRRLEVLGFQVADVMEAANKKMFRKIWTVQIPTEMLPQRANIYLTRLVERVTFVPPNPNTHPNMTNIVSPE